MTEQGHVRDGDRLDDDATIVNGGGALDAAALRPRRADRGPPSRPRPRAPCAPRTRHQTSETLPDGSASSTDDVRARWRGAAPSAFRDTTVPSFDAARRRQIIVATAGLRTLAAASARRDGLRRGRGWWAGSPTASAASPPTCCGRSPSTKAPSGPTGLSSPATTGSTPGSAVRTRPGNAARSRTRTAPGAGGPPRRRPRRTRPRPRQRRRRHRQQPATTQPWLPKPRQPLRCRQHRALTARTGRTPEHRPQPRGSWLPTTRRLGATVSGTYGSRASLAYQTYAMANIARWSAPA